MIFLEPKRRYWSKETGSEPSRRRARPLDRAVVRRPGRDVTLIAYGGTVPTALEAAEAATAEGWDLEVVDLRSLAPFDDETVARLRAPDRPRGRRARGLRGSAATARRSRRG